MKKRYFVFLLCSLVITIFLNAPGLINEQKQSIDINDDQAAHKDPIVNFLSPIEFTSEGTHTFIKHVYNHPEYATDFLPHNFTHVLQFLQHGKQTKQSRIYTKSVCKFFAKKENELSYINPYSYDDMLKQLPDLLEYQFESKTKTDIVANNNTIKEILSTSLQKFSPNAQSPEQFFDGVAQEIMHAFGDKKSNDEVSENQLRQVIVRFIDNGLNKLIWSPDDQKEIWTSIKNISEHLATLTESNIIDTTDDLDDLYWSLTNRFCYFLENMGQYLGPSFFQAVKDDLQNRSLFMLQLEEQEDLMTCKTERIARSLFAAEAKARARQLGLI